MNEPQPKKVGLLTLPWFKPLYRRVIVLVVVAAWSGWEWLGNHDQFWGMVTLAAFAYGIWVFFIDFDKQVKKFEDAQPKD